MLFSRKFLAAWAVLLLSLAGTLVGWQFAARLVEARAKAELDGAAERIESEIRRRMTAYEQVLHAGAALFAASHNVRREEWRDFVAHLKIDQHFPGIQGIGFAQRIAPAELAAHVRAIRAEGFPGYAVRPEGARETYSPIVYLEPFSGRNLRAFGYDMFSEPVRRAAMQRACDTADGALSGKVKLVQETEQDVQAGFLLYVPVYAKVSTTKANAGTSLRNTAAERRAALLGWAYAPFRINNFMRAFASREGSIVDFEIFDGESVGEEALLFDLNESRGFLQPAHGLWQRQDTLALAGHRWTLLFRPQPAFVAGLDATPRLVLAGGTLISLLLFALAAGLATTRARAYALAGRLNRELQHAHDELEVKVEERTRALSEALQHIEQQNQALLEANHARTEFLHTMRHELRTPLNAIIGFAELLTAGIPQPLPEAQRQHARDILEAGLGLLQLINEILLYASAEAGHLPFRPQPIDVKSFLAERLRVLEGRAGQKGIALALEAADDLPRLVADAQHLRTLIDHLLDNAVKFTPEGGRVTLRATNASPSPFSPLPNPPPSRGREKTEEPGERGQQPATLSPALPHRGGGSYFEISVTDSGPGIAAEDLPRLFQPFVQLDPALTRATGGTGMGLALARRLAELHGGDIRVDSEPGRGSSFSVRLPGEGTAQEASP